MFLNFQCASFPHRGIVRFWCGFHKGQVRPCLDLFAFTNFRSLGCFGICIPSSELSLQISRCLPPALSPSCCVWLQFDIAPPLYLGFHRLRATHFARTDFLPPLVCDDGTTTSEFFHHKFRTFPCVQAFEVLQVAQNHSFLPLMIGALSRIVVCLICPTHGPATNPSCSIETVKNQRTKCWQTST